MTESPFRVGFVTGATPDKWARTWRERHPRTPLELVPVSDGDQEDGLRHDQGIGEDSLDMCLVRLPINRHELHCIPLYDEIQVVVASAEHFLAAGDEVTLADLVDEQLVAPHSSGWTPRAEQLRWPEMTAKDAIETVAAGTGVLITPASVARLYARKDVVTRPIPELEPTKVGLAWRMDDEDPRVQDFIGVVRGRTANSSRH